MGGGFFSYKHLNSNSATPVLIVDHPCTLAGVVINTKGATANLLTIYDAAATSATAAGNLIASIDTTAPSGPYAYDLLTISGLTVVLNTGTAADLTISWR